MEEDKNTNEEKEGELEDKPTEDTGKGDKSETRTLIDNANLAAKRMEEANKDRKIQEDRSDEREARNKLAGRAEAGVIKPKEKPITDAEYVEKLKKGEVNPLKEDGFI